MSEVKLYHGDCLEIMKQIPDGSVDMVLADPPYFKVIMQTWDYQWRTVDEYLAWSEKWIGQATYKMRYGATFCCFGYAETLARLLPICENCGIKFRQQIIVDKGIQSVAGRATRNYKMFPTCTESIFVFVKDAIPYVRNILKEAQVKKGISAKEINETLCMKANGGGMWSIWTGNNVCEQLPTEEHWKRLVELLNIHLGYHAFAPTFNPQMGFSDVWSDISFREGKRMHPTQKPYLLIERLVSAYTNRGDSVLDPFMGSGTTGVACVNKGRYFIGIEKEEKYFNIAKERIEKAKDTPRQQEFFTEQT